MCNVTLIIFSLGSQGTPPGEAYMVAAFGESGLSSFTVECNPFPFPPSLCTLHILLLNGQ